MHPIISQTKLWLKQVVIGFNLCPFASIPFKKQLIRYVIFEGRDPEDLINKVVSEIELLTKAPTEKIETSILITPNILQDFDDYYDFLFLCNDILKQLNLEGVIQIASFHPDYIFENTNSESVENFTNRSPYPMFHFLREESIVHALNSYKNPSSIPEKNMETMRYLGLSKIKKILDDIKREN